MKKIFVLGCAVLLFCSTICWAGVFNKAENVKEFINNAEPKAGYVWSGKVFVDKPEMTYVPYVGCSLYTFEAQGDTSLFKIGSIDLGYFKETKVGLFTMIDSKLLEAFNLKLPFGSIELQLGLGLAYDFGDFSNDDIEFKDRVNFGVPTIGFKYNF